MASRSEEKDPALLPTGLSQLQSSIISDISQAIADEYTVCVEKYGHDPAHIKDCYASLKVRLGSLLE